MWEIILDCVIDTLKVVPILYLVYLLVSYLGHNTNNKYAKIMSKTKHYGPLIGGMCGCVPQCGFSVVMSDLYSKKGITIGTLVAVMVATSDEAIPIMIANPDYVLPMLVMIAIKLCVAILFGYLFDIVFKLAKKDQQIDSEVFAKSHAHDCELTSCSHVHVVHKHAEDEVCECKHHKHDHNHEHEHADGDCVHNIFVDALIHTLQITLFLFVASLIIGIIVEYAGIENVSKIFTSNKYVQPFISALVGLIPSCASSVFLVEFYMAGGITFGAMMAGLCAGSGVGIVVLFSKNRKNIKTNLIILVSLYLIGCLTGLVCSLFV